MNKHTKRQSSRNTYSRQLRSVSGTCQQTFCLIACISHVSRLDERDVRTSTNPGGIVVRSSGAITEDCP